MRRLRAPLRFALAPRHESTQAAGGRPGKTWLLDLDNTLHDAMPVIMPRINRAMTDYVARTLKLDHEQASALRAGYWRRYGATLLGMVAHHGVDPHDFLRQTHPFPDLHQIVRRDRRLHAALARLPGRRLIVTNAPHDYARRVVQLLGIAALIEGIVPVETMRFAGRLQHKPSRSMLRRIVARVRAHPSRCVMVEDTIANLASAKALGMTTVLVTGITHGSRPAVARPRAGSARRIGVQVQSFEHLPRRALPRPFNV